jgi:tetratricopeptide (TPR) repeat protein
MTTGSAAELTAAAAAAHEAGQLDEAEALYRQALAVAPDEAEIAHRLGLLALGRDRSEEAVHWFRQAASRAPDKPGPHLALGMALFRLGRTTEAVAVHQRAAILVPASLQLRAAWAEALMQAGRGEDALGVYDAAVALAPDQAELACNRADLLQRLGRFEAAVAAYVAVVAESPGLARAWSNRGVALQALDRPRAAVESFDRALALDPGFVDAWTNRGVALREENRLDESIASLDKAVALAPDRAEARVNLGVSQLLAGDFARGFRNHEERWRIEPGLSEARRFAEPLWLGDEDIAGRTILLHAEQGFGDTLQFCRYAALAKARGARVVLEVEPPLTALMLSLEGVDELVAAGEPLPGFDLHCPLMSLPLAFGATLATIPAPAAYLAPPPGRSAAWAEAVAASPRLKIGIAWFGRPTHRNDRNRSLRLDRLLAAIPEDVEVYGLHDRVRPEDADALAANPRLRRFEHRIGDFADTAALAAQMDLVVSVDTSIAHLAGAIGRPTWVLLPFSPDWRWLLGRADSPWYPSMRLFRQPAIGDWASVMAELHAGLTDLKARTR